MRIALVSSELAVGKTIDGGLGNAVFRLATALIDHGQEVLVIRPGEKAGDTDLKGARVLTVDCRRPSWHGVINRLSLGQFDMGLHMVHLARSLGATIARTQAEKPLDLAHFSNLGGISLFCEPGLPHVIRISSDTPSDRNAGGYDNQNRLAMFQQERLEAWAIRRADGVYGPSRHHAEIAGRRYRRPIEVIRPPVFSETGERDDSVFREKLGKEPYLLFFGRLNRLKGLLVLAEILQPLLAAHPGLRLVVIGREHAGHDGMSMKDYLSLKAGQVAERLIMLDPLPHPRLYPIIENAIAVILPSLVDNLPNTMLESMMLGKVVIGTRGTGMDELIEDGINGLLCRPGDPDDLLRIVERCLSMPEVSRRDLGRAAPQAIQELRPEKTIPPLLEFFERIVQKKEVGSRR